jgi:hypothetical protein
MSGFGCLTLSDCHVSELLVAAGGRVRATGDTFQSKNGVFFSHEET